MYTTSFTVIKDCSHRFTSGDLIQHRRGISIPLAWGKCGEPYNPKSDILYPSNRSSPIVKVEDLIFDEDEEYETDGFFYVLKPHDPSVLGTKTHPVHEFRCHVWYVDQYCDKVEIP